MKKTILTLTAAAAVTVSAFAASINVNNLAGVDSSFFTDITNTPIVQGQGGFSIGYFGTLSDAAVSTAPNTSTLSSDFVSLADKTWAIDGAGFGLDGLLNESWEAPINTGSAFIGKNIYLLGTLGADQAIVIKSTDTFAADAPLFAYSFGPNHLDANKSIILGQIGAAIVGSAGFNATPTFQMAPTVIPEPSTFAFLLGGLAMVFAVVRRRK